ncbi:DUF922 domain-containing protein [Massilia sp. W12]|uniref:DUF922 domain-containing protein n=1 Tax=Massilia sp. W12 TaxID=3126507 RepID=UPI0030D4160A
MRRQLLPLLFAMLPGMAQAAVSEEHQVRHYDVRQTPGQSLFDALERSTPLRENGRSFHGYTRWEIVWNFTFNKGADGLCGIDSVQVKLLTITTLPRLLAAENKVRAEFNPFLAALTRHENGHKQHGQLAAYQIEREIKSMPRMSNCQELKQNANLRGTLLIEKGQQADRDYDAKTRHGCTQGACLTD